MANLYEVLSDLCAKKGITGYKMCKDIAIQPSIMTDLKMGRRSGVNAETAAKIADYFGVSVNYLLGKEELKESAPALNTRDERDISKDMERLRQNLESGEGLMFDGDPLSDEAKESILAAMKIGLEMAKVKNKEKYTPKKFRKENNDA